MQLLKSHYREKGLFEHEIFQPNVRPQNSKESNCQKKLKTLFEGNLNKNKSKKNLK